MSSEIIGNSTEGRSLRLLKVCKEACGNKPAMFIQGGIHAQEWITPAVVMYIAHSLTLNISAKNQDLVNKLDWYILPVLNPDGYYHTRPEDPEQDRLWRKTKSPTLTDGYLSWGMIVNSCGGTDLNRNWDFHWGEIGSSNDICDDEYRGPHPFSEPETAAVSKFLLAHKDEIKFFNDVHSYSQLILLPWGFMSDTPPPDQEDRLALLKMVRLPY